MSSLRRRRWPARSLRSPLTRPHANSRSPADLALHLNAVFAAKFQRPPQRRNVDLGLRQSLHSGTVLWIVVMTSSLPVVPADLGQAQREPGESRDDTHGRRTIPAFARTCSVCARFRVAFAGTTARARPAPKWIKFVSRRSRRAPAFASPARGPGMTARVHDCLIMQLIGKPRELLSVL
jgi:hypothetical protein